jgi:hypothetical protein
MVDRFQNAHAGESCIVIGNGPSLACVPDVFLLSLPTFGANRIWRKFEPTYYVCTDPLDVAKNMKYILARKEPKFVQSTFGIEYPIEVIYQAGAQGWNKFTPDPTQPMFDGATVTYVSLELAYWMGFTTVYLVGVDHRYHWKGSRYKGSQVITITADGSPDPNHFIPNYHLPGEQWQPPNLKRMEQAYKLARAAYEADGRRIINLTPDSALDVFEKASLDEVREGVEDGKNHLSRRSLRLDRPKTTARCVLSLRLHQGRARQ